MNFQTMEYFCAIAEQGSFTRAAASLHVTQQTLSAHIAGVERELGRKLIIRSNPLRLTHEGQTFLAHARRLTRELDDMRREVAGPDNLQAGTLRVGISFTRGRTVLPPVIERFCEQYPNVCVDLREDTNEGIVRDLLSRQIDVAFGVLTPTSPRLEVRPLFRERMVLLATTELLEAHGVDPEAVAGPLAKGDVSPLASCPFVLSPPEDITGRLGIELVARAGFRPKVRAYSRNMATLLSLALRGVGVCVCPKDLLDDTKTPEQDRGLTVYDLGDDATYAIDYALPADAGRWPVAERFVQLALEHVATV